MESFKARNLPPPGTTSSLSGQPIALPGGSLRGHAYQSAHPQESGPCGPRSDLRRGGRSARSSPTLASFGCELTESNRSQLYMLRLRPQPKTKGFLPSQRCRRGSLQGTSCIVLRTSGHVVDDRHWERVRFRKSIISSKARRHSPPAMPGMLIVTFRRRRLSDARPRSGGGVVF